jgi:sulfate adenylyltransferase
MALEYQNELGVTMVPFDEIVYLPGDEIYEERREVRGRSFVELSGSRTRRDFLEKGERVPEWFMRPEIAQILSTSHRLSSERGFCLWFTGLSGAGKSTTAEIVTNLLLRHGRRVTLLDGDVVRTNLSAGLGFDKAGRDANIRRIGFVAAEIVRHGGAVVCAAISPYRDTRDEVREMIGDGFIEVHVDAPLAICEERDPKGMYAKARRGEITNFTGVDDVYEEPPSPEIVIDTVSLSAKENAWTILSYLGRLGFVELDASENYG